MFSSFGQITWYVLSPMMSPTTTWWVLASS